MIVFTCLNAAVLYYKNKRKQHDRGQIIAAHGFITVSGAEQDLKDPDDELRSWVELGDKHPDFVYTY